MALEDTARTQAFCERVLPVLDELRIEGKYKLVMLVLLVTAYKKTGAIDKSNDCLEKAVALGRELEALGDPHLSEA